MNSTKRPLFRRIRIRDNLTGEIRSIEGGEISHCSSPVAVLFSHVTTCVAQIVPERHADLMHQINNGLFIEIDGISEDFYIAARVPERKVILGVAALERIWAYTYFYLALDDFAGRPKGRFVDLTTIPELQPARELAKWAMECERTKSQSPWPSRLPRPDVDDGSDARIALTRDYFLHALCFLILHEIGHITCKHPTATFIKNELYKHEFEADMWAVDFMLGDWQKAGRANSDYYGRYTGITLGLALLSGVELYHHEVSDDHPTIAERLSALFQKYDPQCIGEPSPERDFAVHFASVIINAHLFNAKIPFEFQQEYVEINDYLLAAHKAMAAHKDR